MTKLWKQEMFMYLLMGGLTTLVNLIVFYLVHTVGMVSTLASVVSANIVALLFAYVSNKYWVFNSHLKTTKATVIEAAAFFSVRGLALLLDIAATFICIYLGATAFVAKLLANLIVILVNYIASKWWVFKK